MKLILKEWIKRPRSLITMILYIIFGSISMAITTIVVGLSAKVFAQILNNSDSSNNILYQIGILAICDLVLIGLSKQCRKYSIISMSNSLSNAFTIKVTDADYSMYTEMSESYINRAQEFNAKIVSMGSQIGELCRALLNILISISAIWYFSDKLVVPIIIIYTIGGIIMSFVYKKYIALDDVIREAKRSRNQEVENIIKGFKEVRSFNRQIYHKDRVKDTNVKIMLIGLKRTIIDICVCLLFVGIDYGGMIISIIYGVSGIISGSITLSDAMALITYAGFLINPLNTVLGFIDSASEEMTLASDYQKVMDHHDQKADGKIKLNRFNDKIEINNVHFSYDNQNDILHGVSITIPKGKKIGICGISGGGKSSLFKLLNRFYSPSSGSITMDGINIDDITRQSFYNIIGSVHQDNVVYKGTIRENIMYASPYATEEQLIQACKNAYIYDFIMKQDKKFETEVGPNGIKLSGGQKQRISLARIFLKNPDIILLDEATSALDNKSEYYIQQAIENMKDKTMMIIAHRLSTIQNCDRIYVLENGKILEDGTHDELMKKHGKYYDIYTYKYEDDTE